MKRMWFPNVQENPEKGRVMSKSSGKSLLKSKTFGVNALAAVISVVTAISGLTIFPPAYTPYFLAGLAIANILLRLATNKPITSVK